MEADPTLLIVLAVLSAGLGTSTVILLFWGRARNSKAAQALRQAEGRAAHIVNCARDGIITIDEAGVIQTFNPAAEQMFGYAASEILGTNISDLVPPPDRRRGRGLYTQPAPGRDLSGRRKDGSVFPVDLMLSEIPAAEGKSYSAIVRDVTERRKAEEALARERNFISAVLDNAGALCVVLDSEGRVVRFNRACEELTEYSQGEIKGRHLWEIIAAPSDIPEAESRVRMILASEFPSRTEEVWTARDDSRHLIAWTHTGLSDSLHRVEYIISIGTDITEKRALETQLAHARKMEAVGRLAGGIAHDFNNLLTAITGYSELVYHALDENDPVRKDVEEIRKAGERAASLTRQLLAFSRKQVLSSKVFDLNSIVREMEQMLSRMIGEDIRFKVSVSAEPAWIKADLGQMQQVLLNLVLNARDAMTVGGDLTVETSRVALSVPLAYADQTLPAGPYVLLKVTDTGCGMEPETISRVFEPFFTTKDVGQGTGLGLATVYGIVRQTGGLISVESKVGRGSMFKVYLPQASGEAAAGPSAAAASHAGPGGTETVLVAEDEEEVRHLVRKVLESKGYHVLTAATGEEALVLANAFQGPIHLLLADVVMPRIPGPELARRLQEARPDVGVLFISGHAQPTLEQYGASNTSVNFLLKPLSPESLARKVRQALDARAELDAGTS